MHEWCHSQCDWCGQHQMDIMHNQQSLTLLNPEFGEGPSSSLTSLEVFASWVSLITLDGGRTFSLKLDWQLRQEEHSIAWCGMRRGGMQRASSENQGEYWHAKSRRKNERKGNCSWSWETQGKPLHVVNLYNALEQRWVFFFWWLTWEKKRALEVRKQKRRICITGEEAENGLQRTVKKSRRSKTVKNAK